MTNSPQQPSTQQAPGQPAVEINQMSYEQARAELVATVQALEAGNLTLEDSVALWKRGEALADRCQAWLDSARDMLSKAQEAREETAN